MGELHEHAGLKNRVKVFRDRYEAGQGSRERAYTLQIY